MYTPIHFKTEDLPEIHGIMRAARLSTLVTAHADGLIGTPLPLFLDESEGPFGTLYGHLAKPNPQWKTPVTSEGLVIFNGPDAYVTPSWYVAKREHGKVVPTWNYVAVHTYGPVEFFEDADRLLTVVTRLTGIYESGREPPWQVTDAPPDFIQGQLRGIVGLRIPITRIEGKRKLSQNRKTEDREGVAAGLAVSDRPEEREVSTMIPR